MRKKIIIGIMIFLAILFGYCTKSQAAIVVSNKQVNSEEQFSISVTSDVPLISYQVVIDNHEGLTFVNSSGGAGAGTKKVSNALTEGTTKQLAIFTFKAPKVDKDTQYTITFTGSGMGKEDFSKVDNDTKKITITVKAPVVTPPQPDPDPTPTPEPPKPVVEEKPNFTNVNKTMYTTSDINLRESWSTSSKATQVEKGTELKVTATSTKKVNNYVWYRVTYNNQTLYVASNLLTTTKPVEKEPEKPVEKPVVNEDPKKEDEPENIITKFEIGDGLKSLTIEGLILSPEFNANTNDYTVTLREDIDKLDIQTETTSKDYTVSIAGNENLRNGENLITIVVRDAKKVVVTTYQITVIKNTIDESIINNIFNELNARQSMRNIALGCVVAGIVALSITYVVLSVKASKVSKIKNSKKEEKTVKLDFEDENVEKAEIEQEIQTKKEIEEIQDFHKEENTEEKKVNEKKKGKHF